MRKLNVCTGGCDLCACTCTSVWCKAYSLCCARIMFQPHATNVYVCVCVQAEHTQSVIVNYMYVRTTTKFQRVAIKFMVIYSGNQGVRLGLIHSVSY